MCVRVGLCVFVFVRLRVCVVCEFECLLVFAYVCVFCGFVCVVMRVFVCARLVVCGRVCFVCACVCACVCFCL